MVTILSFFNDCSLQELTSVPTMSAKKAEKIIKMRPFDSWNDLVRMLMLTCLIHPYTSVLHHVHVGLQCTKCSCLRKGSEKQGSSLKCMRKFSMINLSLPKCRMMWYKAEWVQLYVTAFFLEQWKCFNSLLVFRKQP